VSQRIEDYALIGDTHTAALVGRDGSIDWLCLPRFDSGSCFAKLLGDDDHGRWRIAVDGPVISSVRRYRSSTLVLETDISTEGGTVRVIDFMPPRHRHPRVVRIVQGIAGVVRMRTDVSIRFEYGHDVPWVHQTDRGLHAVAGPNAVCVDSPVELQSDGPQHQGSFTVSAGEETAFVLSWFRSYDEVPFELDTSRALSEAVAYWQEWCDGIEPTHGAWEEQVLRSLITLKALTYSPTGGIVAAPTTSLPESVGGVRNWDYRFCWVRDASLTLSALLDAGLAEEAEAWGVWIARAALGAPEQLQTMYGVSGERRLTELELGWLPGYEGSAPVRIGNDAAEQFQLDVYGELMDAIDRARRHGLVADGVFWELQLALMDFLCKHWRDPDEGIWEVRGPRRHFTHSKVMVWVAFDRAVRAVESYGLNGPVALWRTIREEIHTEVCSKGWNSGRQAFTQSYGVSALDASILIMPQVGFLPADDPRVVSTVEAVQQELMVGGFVMRYLDPAGVDGLPGGEGAFLPCSLWLANCLALMGRDDDAREVFARVVALVNDVGLISEEYDMTTERLVGNFPQAFTHVGIINTAQILAVKGPPATPAEAHCERGVRAMETSAGGLG
jgi:GH15 family glucan-1,4-alpha-glucosidase